MKKFKFLLVLLAFLFPIVAFAEGEEEQLIATNNEVKLYFFRGEGCSHCAEAEAWFESIEEEYGSMFEVVDYETWYNEENSQLMQRVAKARGEKAEGVPYIIIGNKSWAGFAQDYTGEMIDQIKSEYAKDPADRYDIIALLPEEEAKKEKSTGSDVFALVIILVITGGICYGVYKARNTTK